MHSDSKAVTVHSLDRITLRLSTATFGEIDEACAARSGNVSRNTWITEAVEEKLARERAASAPLGHALNRRGPVQSPAARHW